MSQIPHSQLSLKKRSTPVVVLENDTNKLVRQKVSKNGHKTENGDGHNKSDKDIIVLYDEYDSVPVGREEIIDDQVLTQKSDETVPLKKKRGRIQKKSTDSREFDEMFLPLETTPTKKDEVTIAESTEDLNKSEPSIPTVETKIVKLSTDSLPVSSKRRSDRLQNASTIVNLSTVSSTDSSTKVSNDTAMTIETPCTDRKVSGRRSTRPIDDIKFTYRSPDPDDSIANATIGSEIGDSLLETPLTGSKRRMESMENIDSPKRSRFDLSALFNNFYSPLSLRDRFRRTNLASTPKVDGILDETASSIDTSASDMKDVDLNEKSDETKAVEEEKGRLRFIVKPAPKKSTCSIM